VGENGHLAGTAEDVGAFRHEIHAAEDDVLACGAGSLLRKPVRIATKIGETNHFIALIVMTEDYGIAAQGFSGSKDAVVQRVIRQDKIIVQRADGWSSSQAVSRFQFRGGMAHFLSRPERGC